MADFTEAHKTIILEALDKAVESNNRTKGKSPRFAEIIDKDISIIRECQGIIRTWATVDKKSK